MGWPKKSRWIKKTSNLIKVAYKERDLRSVRKRTNLSCDAPRRFFIAAHCIQNDETLRLKLPLWASLALMLQDGFQERCFQYRQLERTSEENGAIPDEALGSEKRLQRRDTSTSTAAFLACYLHWKRDQKLPLRSFFSPRATF